MSLENGRFIVDSTGEAEFQEIKLPDNPTALRIGNTAIPLGDQPLSVDQIGDSKYFAEPGGRLIDTETGETITHGDGTNKVSLGDITAHEKRT
jgi:hypothetical protein